jgi:hypothetical protein
MPTSTTSTPSARIVRLPRLTTPFSRLPRLERAKLVAKDVLARYRAAQLTLKPGVLIEVTTNLRDDRLDNSSLIDLQARLKAGRPCSVCALGAAACGIAAFDNHITLQLNSAWGPATRAQAGIESESASYPRLRRLFGKQTMKIIECAFENGKAVFGYNGTDDDTFRCHFTASQVARIKAFVAKRPTHKERFEAIFKQIARTGTFVP